MTSHVGLAQKGPHHLIENLIFIKQQTLTHSNSGITHMQITNLQIKSTPNQLHDSSSDFVLFVTFEATVLYFHLNFSAYLFIIDKQSKRLKKEINFYNIICFIYNTYSNIIKTRYIFYFSQLF